jgi:hypothetical protein
MKTIKIFCSVLFFTVIFFASCNPNEIDDVSIYWNTNTLTRLQLNGNVKKVVSNSGKQVDEFNHDGYITKSVYTDTDFSSTTIYNYDSNGKLLSIDFTSTGGKGAEYTTTFEYQNINKYVVQNKYHLLMDGLAPNLKARINDYSRSDYVMEGSNLKIIESHISEGITYRDTTLVEYDGKYPSKITSGELLIDNISYASNGMFLNYTKTTQTETWSSECVYYFKPDNQYLMLDSMVQTSIDGAFTRIDKDEYQYDVNKNMTGFKNYMGEYKYIYSYLDATNNWTIKETQYRPINTTTWGNSTTETREITYW